MTNKELLELAAKAADYGFTYKREISNDAHEWTSSDGMLWQWNPLVDDAQAMRLAVKLNISLSQEFDNEGVDYAIAVFWLPNYREIYEPHGENMYAANRKLIVMAAAEIGKTL